MKRARSPSCLSTHPVHPMRGVAAASVLWALAAVLVVPLGLYGGMLARRAWEASPGSTPSEASTATVGADRTGGVDRAGIRSALREARVNATYLEEAIEEATRWLGERAAAEREEADLGAMLADAAGIACAASQREDERLRSALERADAEDASGWRLLEGKGDPGRAAFAAQITRIERVKAEIVEAAIDSQQAHARIDRTRREESLRLETRIDALLDVRLAIEREREALQDRLERRVEGMGSALGTLRAALRAQAGRATTETDRSWLRTIQSHTTTFRKLLGRVPTFPLGAGSVRAVRTRFHRRKMRAVNELRIGAAERCGPSRSEIEHALRDAEAMLGWLKQRRASIGTAPVGKPSRRPAVASANANTGRGATPAPRPRAASGKHPWAGMTGNEVLRAYPGALLYGYDSAMYSMTLVFRDPQGVLVRMAPRRSGRTRYDEQREFGAYAYAGPKALPPGSPWKSAQIWRKKRGSGSKTKYFR